MFALYNDLTKQVLKYLLTFILFHAEFFFAVKARGGFGFKNNPNAFQFQVAYKQLLICMT